MVLGACHRHGCGTGSGSGFDSSLPLISKDNDFDRLRLDGFRIKVGVREDPLDVGAAELYQAALDQDWFLGIDVLGWDLEVGNGKHPTLFMGDGTGGLQAARLQS